jgi:hypothetical protein
LPQGLGAGCLEHAGCCFALLYSHACLQLQRLGMRTT